MHGPDFPRPDPAILDVLRRASTATITTIFRRRGIRNIWMPIKPLFPGMRTVGPALTIRSVPGRDDLQSIAYEPGTPFPGHPDDAIDAVRPGDVVVLDGRGATDEGLFGDLLTQRIKEMGAAGLVCDMAVRDGPHMAEKNLPIFCLGTASPGGTVFNVDYNVPIGCAGVLVCPGDLIVGDDDGVVVVPQGLAREVAAELLLREDKDEFVRLKLAEGASLRGLYPMGPEWEAKFQEWRRQRRPS
ncbi:MAG: ribonuclease activity regulator RraA [Chloroflexi bacterium]|nr:ribonuclease activity regulator RraA [Chloroflexota bacterium]